MVKPLLQNLWVVRFFTALIWALVAASVLYWALALSGASESGSGQVAQAAPLSIDAQGTPYLLGVRQAQIEAPVLAQAPKDRYQLVGVLAGTQSQQGAALIALNGQAAKPYRVGATLEGADGFVLHSLSGRTASLGQAGQTEVVQVLELPEFSPGDKKASKPARAAANPSNPAQRGAIVPLGSRPQVQREL